MEKLSKSDPDFYSKISQMRKVKSGGKYFLDKKAARAAQAKGAEVKRAKKSQRNEKV